MLSEEGYLFDLKLGIVQQDAEIKLLMAAMGLKIKLYAFHGVDYWKKN